MKGFFSAYYYSFEATDCPEIDEILKEIANAGEGCHHTEDWIEYGYIEKIQAAANKAADSIKAAQQSVHRTCAKCGSKSSPIVDMAGNKSCPECGASR